MLHHFIMVLTQRAQSTQGEPGESLSQPNFSRRLFISAVSNIYTIITPPYHDGMTGVRVQSGRLSCHCRPMRGQYPGHMITLDQSEVQSGHLSCH